MKLSADGYFLLRNAILAHQDQPQFVKRCQCILFLSLGMTPTEVMTLFKINRRAVNKWVQFYQRDGLAGLMDRYGQGVKEGLPAGAAPDLPGRPEPAGC
ncbi:helix-turn-helix domain-containing protein [Larkinella soli]|uniref:helix-turn-helix domain-containing protein n=1 Tax=Larkinella soli TaxID=1770527 RepID=UPI000FFB9625|nr:helix-turn-helix domain-containing protein [Larkinella soli]